MPDLFIDDDIWSKKEQDLNALRKSQQRSSDASSSDSVSPVFDKINGFLSDALVKEVGGVFQFKLSGAQPGEWFLDLKNGAGKSALTAFPCVLWNLHSYCSVKDIFSPDK